MADVEARDVFRESRFEWEGRTWKIQRPNFKTEAVFSTYLERRAFEGIERHRATIGEFAYREAIQAVTRDIAAGVYSWGSPMCIQAQGADVGLKELLFLVLTQADGQTQLDRERFDQMWAACAKEIVKGYLEVIAPVPVPNSQPAATPPPNT